MTDASTPARSTRLNVAILATAQVLFQCTQSMSIATTPLAAYAMLGTDKTLATVPVFMSNFGLMLVTLPAALLMGRVGRKAGFSLGALLGIIGGLTSFSAIYLQHFGLLCLGALLQGSSGAFAWHYRFAAADMATVEFRPKALSLVMAGGVVAGLLGPQTAKWAVDLFNPMMFAGVYAVLAVFSLGMMLMVQLVDIPFTPTAESGRGGRPMREIARQPRFIAAVLSSMFGYAVMTLVMSATPLAMQACGFTFVDSATVIQMHIIGMFLPSFFTGHLIARFGVLTIIAAGGVIEFAGVAANLAGIDFANFVVANVLVGLGWNFAYVGGSTLLTTTYAPAERAKVQASHDFTVYAATATSAALSGVLQAKAGWIVINLAAVPLMAVVVGAAVWLMAQQRRVAVAPAE